MDPVLLRQVSRIVEAASRGKLASARQGARALLGQRPGGPISFALGQVLFVTRDYHESLAAFDAAADQGLAAAALRQKYESAVQLGWEQDAREALAVGMLSLPDRPFWRGAALSLHARRRDFDAAYAHGVAFLAMEPVAVGALVELAGVHAARGDRRRALRCLSVALAQPAGEAVRLEAARLLRGLGAFDEARAQLRLVLAADPANEVAGVMTAELLLWGGDVAGADEIARAQLRRGPSAGALRLLGAVAWLQGRAAEARERLEEALRVDPQESEAQAWLAEISLRAGDHAQAHARLSSAVASARAPLFAAQLLRLRTVAEEPSPSPLGAGQFHHLLPAMAALCPSSAGRLDDGDRALWREAIDEALSAMHGNRSVVPTFLSAAGLAVVPAGLEPRPEARRALERIRVASPDDVIAELLAQARSFPRSSLPDAHLGELLLWLGDVAGGRAALERSISVVHGTRWAYIGLTMADILDGQPERALATCAEGIRVMNNTEGPAVYVHRGEALRLLGRLDEAAADLERSAAMHPRRIGAWVNLGLLRRARGDEAGMRAVGEQILERAPGFLSDAARAARVELFGDEPGLRGGDALAAALEQARVMLRGNRSSSCVSYFSHEGLLRFASNNPEAPLHTQDRERLAAAARVLRQPGGESRARRPRPAAPRPPEGLSSEQLEHFLAHGYIVLRGALPRSFVDAWVSDACARVVRDPGRFADCAEASDRSHLVPQFRADDPATWAWKTLIIRSEQSVDIEHLSPRLWQAVAGLVGGPGRLKTRSLANHFILRFPEPRDSLARFEWHVDDPSRDMRLDTLHNGLVGFALFSDVDAEGGATRILPGSIGPVTRLLEAHPGGIDLTPPEHAMDIASRCEEVVSVHGQAGDVFLAHPLVVHAASKNFSGRIRWMGNPMFYLDDPLDPFRSNTAALSPVERVMARALGRPV